MFAYDQSSLPQLTTRRALICVDFQHDFTSKVGSLAVSEPKDYVSRAVKLANEFRQLGGDIVWVKTEFENTRPENNEQIIISSVNINKIESDALDPEDEDVDEEAFLSHEKPQCVRAGSEGSEWDPAVKEAQQTPDLVITKSHYSAFAPGHLLRSLRAKMVMEVFICGSLANIGVYATAVDAARHGMNITVVEDCCGYRDRSRQRRAMRSLLSVTGCEIIPCEEVLKSIRPPAPKEPKATSRANGRKKKEKNDGADSNASDIVESMTNLTLSTTSHASDKMMKVAKGGQSGADKADGEADPRDQESSKLQEATTPESKDQITPEMDRQKGADDDKDTTKGKEDVSIKESLLVLPTTPSTKVLNTPSSPKTMDDKTSSQPNEDARISDAEVPNDESNMAQKGLCEGDTDVIENLLSPDVEKDVFENLRKEVKWQRMSHQGGEVPRLVAVQGLVSEDGSIPIYRHPSDESPPLLTFSPAVLAIKSATEKCLGHLLNHVLIQFYRDGNDYISEHSDKTLDIVKGSYIANVSLGAERTMVLRTKRPDKDPSRSDTNEVADTKRKIQRARLPHNSLYRMGLKTNEKWLHAIRQDKRAEREKTPAELAYSGGRISLTFRQIGTFLSKDEKVIWGQGATAKTQEDAQPVINGQSPEAVKMLQAFGTENHSSNFDWEAYYGKGFDVLHMSSSPRFFASSDSITNLRVSLMLAEMGIGVAKGVMGTPAKSAAEPDIDDIPVKFIDNDADKSKVRGDIAIMLYLDAKFGGKKGDLARRYTRFQQGISLTKRYRLAKKALEPDFNGIRAELAVWDDYVKEVGEEFLAGTSPSLPDFILWPVLDSVVLDVGADELFAAHKNLEGYYERLKGRKKLQKVMEKVEKKE